MANSFFFLARQCVYVCIYVYILYICMYNIIHHHKVALQKSRCRQWDCDSLQCIIIIKSFYSISSKNKYYTQSERCFSAMILGWLDLVHSGSAAAEPPACCSCTTSGDWEWPRQNPQLGWGEWTHCAFHNNWMNLVLNFVCPCSDYPKI